MVFRLDFSVAQDLFKNLGGARHSLQFRADFLNFSNLLNHDWGVGQRLVNAQPLTNPGVDSQGRATYRLRVVNNELMSKSWETTAGLSRTSTRSSSACGTPSTRLRASGTFEGRAGLIPLGPSSF